MVLIPSARQLSLYFQLDVTEEDCFSLFPLETLVYLTPDSEHRESLTFFPCGFTKTLSLVFCGTSVLTPYKRLWEEILWDELTSPVGR